jgi:hypothetical protein
MESELESYRAKWSSEKDMWVLERTRGGGLLPMRRGDPAAAWSKSCPLGICYGSSGLGRI